MTHLGHSRRNSGESGGEGAHRKGQQVDVVHGHRVGVTLAYDVPGRFWVADEPTVSAYKRSPRAPV